MVEIVRIPKLGLSDFGEITSWEVSLGEQVSEDEVVVVIESEKASAEIVAPTDGTLLERYVAEGEEIAIDVGKPLGAIGTEGEAVPALEELSDEHDPSGQPQAQEQEPQSATRKVSSSSGSQTTDPSDIKATPRAKKLANQEDVELPAVEGTGPQGAITTDDIERYLEKEDDKQTEVKATPRAKRRAQEEDVELAAIEGTGPQDAVTTDDIDAYLESRSDGPAGAESGVTVTESRTLSGTRKTIADRLSRSAREKPHVMGTREIPIEQLERVQSRLEERYEVDVSLNDLLLYFVGRVLDDLPEFNAHFEDGEHRLIEEINIGYAVDGSRGLVVPVIDDVIDRSLPDLAQKRRSLVKRVLDDEHMASDLQGGTFTVTNVGVFDMDVSYSIINPPQVAILAIGRRKYAPIERGGDVEFEKVITFSLTIDHRVLDGADSGAFLDRLAEYVEHPGVVLDDV